MIALLAAFQVGCAAAVSPARGTTVNSTLTDQMTMTTGYGGNTGMMGNSTLGLISVDRNSVPSGQVTFVVKNGGLLVHEFVVLRTDVAHDKIADSSEPGKVDEAGSVGETGAINAGESKGLTLTLAAGHYVLMCNEVGHYDGGMHVGFTVN